MLGFSLRPGKEFTRPDLRNHRKIVVIDGVVGYTGSQNIVKNNYHRKDDLYYEELVARVEGPVVWQLSAIFRTDWYAETHTFLSADALAPLSGSMRAQVLPSGPSYRESSNLKLYTALMHGARKKIVIVTPYFVPDDALMTALTSAAQRGVGVTIVNSETIDKILVGHAQRSYYEELLLAGVRVFLYKKPVFLHTKHMTIDDTIAVVGSSNIDIRSFELDLEVSLVLYDKTSVVKLRSIEERYIKNSRQINLTSWLKRPLRLKSLDSVARLTASLQ
jgi:cardiolipin synthase